MPKRQRELRSESCKKTVLRPRELIRPSEKLKDNQTTTELTVRFQARKRAKTSNSFEHKSKSVKHAHKDNSSHRSNKTEKTKKPKGYHGSADPIAKDKANATFIEGLDRCKDIKELKQPIVVFDYLFNSVRKLRQAGYVENPIYVPECRKDHYEQMKKMNEESKTGPLAHLSNEYFSDFIKRYKGPVIGAVFHDGHSTVTGNKDCDPLKDIKDLFSGNEFSKNLLAKTCCFAITCSHRGKVSIKKCNQNVARVTQFINEMTAKYKWNFPEWSGWDSYKSVFFSMYRLTKPFNKPSESKREEKEPNMTSHQNNSGMNQIFISLSNLTTPIRVEPTNQGFLITPMT